MLYHVMHILFLNKMFQKKYENISTDGEVMLKIKVAWFFLGHGVVLIDYNQQWHRWYGMHATLAFSPLQRQIFKSV